MKADREKLLALKNLPPDQRKDRVSKRSKKTTTVDNMLASENVKDLFDAMLAQLPEITDVICVFKTRDGNIQRGKTPHTEDADIIFMLSRAEHLTQDEMDEREEPEEEETE